MNPQPSNLSKPSSKHVVVIGGGPAGLMAAEVIATAGYAVSLYDAMPSVGRKFLLAGVGGMNITHSEPHEKLLTRYTDAAPQLKKYLNDFSAQTLRDWIHGLGIETFVGTSGRVFPSDMKAAPLLRVWLHRLRELGVKFYPRHQWLGWAEDGALMIAEIKIHADATVLALGGASWQRLGSDGAWVALLREKNISVSELLPSNCGFDVQWSSHLQTQYAGQPLPTVCLSVTTLSNELYSIHSEAVITKTGIEGTGIYALSASLRELIRARGEAQLHIDLLPDFSKEKIIAQLEKPRGKNSMSNFLRKQLNLSPVKMALLRELTPADSWQNTAALAQAIKNITLHLTRCRPIDEAISSAGGVDFPELNSSLMLKKLPGVFCAGEMLNWEAPTGGYLLTACFATGRAAGLGVVEYLHAQ
jgi:uncharacterized flavoprotein (TIGR03862 family)